VVARGKALRLTDIDGGGNLALTVFRARDTSERYYMGDALKQQFTSRYEQGDILFSDMGRSLLSVVEDGVGGHDPFGGLSDARLLLRLHGASSYQQDGNERWRSGRDALETELSKYGLARRDLADVVNFFSVVDVAEDGSTSLREGHSRRGDQVTLRADLDCLVALYAGPHPHSKSSEWLPRPIGIEIFDVGPAGPSDPVRLKRPENERGMLNSDLAHEISIETSGGAVA
jgi:urea carboxylase-associated protein 2